MDVIKEFSKFTGKDLENSCIILDILGNVYENYANLIVMTNLLNLDDF